MVSENFNIEAPNYLSKESEVLIYARQDSQCIDCFQAFLPVHYRYHQPHIKDGETKIQRRKPFQSMKVVNDGTSFQIRSGFSIRLFFSPFI